MLVALGTASLVCAQTNAPETKSPRDWPRTQAAGPNRFGLGYRFGLNIRANFKNTGVLPLAAPGNPVGGPVDHTYNDGYVKRDSSDNFGGETWNWDYNSASQVHGDNVVLSASTPGDLANNTSGDPQHGLELTYNRELGRAGKCPWGLEAAFGFTDLTFRNRATVSGGPLTVDSYAAGSPPSVPPHGTFDGPGRLLYDTPTRLPVTVDSRLDGSLYGFRLGPYLELPLGGRVSFALSGGLALAVAQTDFRFQQSYTALNGDSVSQSRAGSHADVLPGGFLAGNFSCRLTKALTVFVGAQYQNTGTYAHNLADKRAEIDLGQCVFVTAGIGMAF